MEYVYIYSLQLANGLDFFRGFLIAVLLLIGIILLAINIIGTIENATEDRDNFNKAMKKPFLILLVVVSFLALFPSKQTLLLMGGTYIGKKAVNAVATDEKIQKVGTIIDLELDKRIRELQEKNK